ncbi:MAG: hypothetical protein A4E48_01975 [Methanosaeta sp. PtaU1.Bin060]|nr:MAG: hypothetical protein A4E48_01975 [Methanosaeta sp. PtaU1.Bin060]
MSGEVDWSWKLREAIERIKTQYMHIGRSSGAPFLAIIYPPEAEVAVLKEWQTLSRSLGEEFDFEIIDILPITASVLDDLGINNVLESIRDPMPGSNPESELGSLWIDAIKNEVKAKAYIEGTKKKVIVLENLAALYPATTPHAVMQELWSSDDVILDCPVVLLIPGTLNEPRVYSFLNIAKEFVYRGDVL